MGKKRSVTNKGLRWTWIDEDTPQWYACGMCGRTVGIWGVLPDPPLIYVSHWCQKCCNYRNHKQTTVGQAMKKRLIDGEIPQKKDMGGGFARLIPPLLKR